MATIVNRLVDVHVDMGKSDPLLVVIIERIGDLSLVEMHETGVSDVTANNIQRDVGKVPFMVEVFGTSDRHPAKCIK